MTNREALAAKLTPQSDTGIAVVRTTFTAFWTGFVIWVSAKLGWELDPESPLSIAVIAATGGMVWRASELAARIPYVGYVLFGVNKAPGYVDSPPAPENPVVQVDPPVEAPVVPADREASFGGFVGD